MSREAVRAGLVTWFTGQVPGVNAVFDTFPKPMIPPEAYLAGQPAGSGSGAAVVVFLGEERETRLTVPAITGWKRIEYTVDLDVFHRSSEANASDAMRSFDRVMEGLKARVREDPTLGGISFQSGEGDSARLDGTYADPVLNGNLVDTWGRLTFNLTEMIQA